MSIQHLGCVLWEDFFQHVQPLVVVPDFNLWSRSFRHVFKGNLTFTETSVDFFLYFVKQRSKWPVIGNGDRFGVIFCGNAHQFKLDVAGTGVVVGRTMEWFVQWSWE